MTTVRVMTVANEVARLMQALNEAGVEVEPLEVERTNVLLIKPYDSDVDVRPYLRERVHPKVQYREMNRRPKHKGKR